METESLLFSIVIIILLALNTYLIYKNKKDFSCPTCNCPKCDAPTICDIPSNQAFVNLCLDVLVGFTCYRESSLTITLLLPPIPLSVLGSWSLLNTPSSVSHAVFQAIMRSNAPWHLVLLLHRL